MTNLSQDEINALLGGSSDSDDPGAVSEDGGGRLPAEDFIEPEPSEPAAGGIKTTGALDDDQTFNTSDYLTDEEVDLLGEVGNICMGAVATTMYTLLDHRVSITTPRVHVYSVNEVLASYTTPYIVVDVQYVEGIEGKNLLLLKEPDAILITDLLMGGDGSVEEGAKLSELHMSAINEIMNQMIASSATALSKILSTPINISPPTSNYVGINTDVSGMLDTSELVIKISFDMEIEGLLKSQLLQLMPYTLGRDMAAKLMAAQKAQSANVGKPDAPPPPAQPVQPDPSPAAAPQPPAQAHGRDYPPQPAPASGNLVDVRPVNYPSFDQPPAGAGHGAPKSFDLVSDIPLSVSVELGKTKKTISEVLGFGIGTIVVLDKIAGEHVEVLVNGKLIASGEVVVIDENYGVRITDIYDA